MNVRNVVPGVMVVNGNVMQMLIALMTVLVAHRLMVRIVVVIGLVARVTGVRMLGLVLFWSTIGFRAIGIGHKLGTPPERIAGTSAVREYS